MSSKKEKDLATEVSKLAAYIDRHLSRNMAVGDALGKPGVRMLERIVGLAEEINAERNKP